MVEDEYGPIIERTNNVVGEISGVPDLYSNNSVRLIGMNHIEYIDTVDDEENDIISDASDLSVDVKQVYKDKSVLAEVMKHYAFVNKFTFNVKRSSSTCYYLVCPSKNCTWFLKSSSLNQSGLFKIRKYCDTKKIYTPRDIADDILKLHGVTLSYMQAWRSKEKAVKMLRGDPTESYTRIPAYFYILDKHYPGSVLSLEKTEDNRFLFAFVALEASIREWEYCRPVIDVDGAHLKCSYGGTILIASTLDPGEMHLEKDKICASSQIGMRVYGKNVEDLKKLFFAMAKAYTLQQFEELMRKVDEIDKKIRKYLFGIGYHKWTMTHATVNHTWVMTSNIAESINNTNRLARKLPVVSLLDFMKITIQSWSAKHSEEAGQTKTDLTEPYNKILEDNREISHRMTVSPSTQFLHTITDGARRFTMCLRSRKCSCGRFQLDEIPCGHAMAAIGHRNKHGEDYCSEFYNNKNFQDAYEIPVEPLPCESTWEIPSHVLDQKLLPPDYKRGLGKPPMERKKSYSEGKFKRAKVIYLCY
ncbi:uncharacterized protein LOC125852399 [Solanum stenotomum]|uniref:uncharacterized protein LOC125852399 n=1 Tax=Solanum stenotomum TaxID=172797 RepID=UPI0020D0028D|nr:uncharacterized protein LOC125852399 [Solanum stenotomum]